MAWAACGATIWRAFIGRPRQRAGGRKDIEAQDYRRQRRVSCYQALNKQI